VAFCLLALVVFFAGQAFATHALQFKELAASQLVTSKVGK